MKKLQLQDVQNLLDTVKQENKEMQNVVFHNADARLGKRIALARKGDLGSVNVISDFMTYSEMNQFLFGYYFKSINKFKRR